jgi:hypothetical protein
MMAAAEAETRRLLARYGEPRVAAPPADLPDRVMRSLSDTPAGAHHSSRLRRIYGGVILAGLAALLAFGAWGVLLDSSGPAQLFGDMGGGIGQLLLVLTLAAKPLVNLLLTAGAVTLVITAAFAGGGWLWWQLVRHEVSTAMEAGV